MKSVKWGPHFGVAGRQGFTKAGAPWRGNSAERRSRWQAVEEVGYVGELDGERHSTRAELGEDSAGWEKR